MKIAYVYDGTYPYMIGGIEKRIWELSSRLIQRGHEVTIFGMKHWEGDDIMYKEGVRLWGVCPPQEFYTNGRRSIKEALYFSWKVQIPLLRERFDVIDCQNFPYFPCFSAKLASIVKRSKLVITWHEVWGNYWFEYLGRKGIIGKAIEKIVSRISNKIVANSEATKKDLERLGVNKNITTIPNGVDFKKASVVSHSNESSDVIFVGRLIKEKNADLLVKAISHVKKEIPNIQCIIVGEGPEKENLKKLVYEADLIDNINLCGFVESEEQVFSLMKSSKTFVLPSVREGFGIASLEANICGLPVITVRHPQNATCDLITDNENGFICDVSDQDIADKILMSINSNENWEEKCTEFAKRYNWDAIVESLEELYEA